MLNITAPVSVGRPVPSVDAYVVRRTYTAPVEVGLTTLLNVYDTTPGTVILAVLEMTFLVAVVFGSSLNPISPDCEDKLLVCISSPAGGLHNNAKIGELSQYKNAIEPIDELLWIKNWNVSLLDCPGTDVVVTTLLLSKSAARALG